MPAVYDLLQDYGSPDTSISMAPVWVLAVVRWSHPYVFDRAQLVDAYNIDAFEQVQSPLVITSDCTHLSVSGNKGAHVTNLSATLRDNDVNYLSSIYPDDWLLAWILPNESRAKDLMKRLAAGKACNGFSDGLKFFGRVGTIFKDTAVDDAGKPASVFNLTGIGFSEFDYSMFWEPLLKNQESLPVWYQRLGIFLNNVITGSNKSVSPSSDPQGLDVNKMIPALIRLIFGEGPFKNGNLSAPGGANASLNGGIRAPSLVGKLLGIADTENLTLSNVMNIVVGVQKYRGAAGAAQNSPAIFTPDGLQGATIAMPTDTGKTIVEQLSTLFEPESKAVTAEYKKTDTPLLGVFPIVQLPFQDTPVWQILEQFLNPAVNEMYVALKPNENGDVFPLLTVRQYPFSTSKFAASSSVPVTAFLELPRWRIHSRMLKRIQVGRSNALRANFWHVQTTGSGQALTKELQYVGPGGPKSDRSDIERSGLRRVVRTVNCFIRHPDEVAPWRDLVVDMTTGQHLTLTGTIATVGIVSPIAPGDNVQFANVVYHVESVNHVCSMTPDGKRDWKTTLQVTRGMADETTLDQNTQDSSLDAPLQDYAGVRNADPASVRVGRTVYDNNLGVK